MCRPVDRELNNQQIEEFFDTGFTTAEQFFDDREMSEISSGFRCMDGETTRFEIRKIAWGGGAVPVLLHYGRHPRLLQSAIPICCRRSARSRSCG